MHQLAQYPPRFRARYPLLHLNRTAPGVVDAAHQDHDISVVSVDQQPLEGDFAARQLARSSFNICASPDCLKRRGYAQHPVDLWQHDGMLPTASAVRRELTLTRVGVDDHAGVPRTRSFVGFQVSTFGAGDNDP